MLLINFQLSWLNLECCGLKPVRMRVCVLIRMAQIVITAVETCNHA